MDHNSTSSEHQPLHEHPAYTAGLTHLNSKQWQQATESFLLLQEAYPDNIEVKELLAEVRMRTALARSQFGSGSGKTRRRPIIIALLGLAMIILAGFAAYEFWIDPVIMHELRVRQITDLRNQADDAIANGDYTQARQALEQIQAIFPEDSEAAKSLRQIEQVEKLSGLYEQAEAYVEAGSWDQAVEVLTELQKLDEHYRDLPQLLQVAQEAQALEQQFQTAETALTRGDWPAAIAQYEALQQTALTFRFEEIQARLFESHLSYGQELVTTAETDPEQIAEALTHFSAALKLRPVDTTALNERRLAETYLDALNSTDQAEVIALLQTIYDEQPTYAGQAAVELLYTTLLARADTLVKAGDKMTAVADYQIAAELPVENPEEAQQKLAELASELSTQ